MIALFACYLYDGAMFLILALHLSLIPLKEIALLPRPVWMLPISSLCLSLCLTFLALQIFSEIN